MPKRKKETYEVGSLLMQIGHVVLSAVEDSGLLVKPKATRTKKGAKRKRRTKAEMEAARAPKKVAKPLKPKPPVQPEVEAEEEED